MLHCPLVAQLMLVIMAYHSSKTRLNNVLHSRGQPPPVYTNKSQFNTSMFRATVTLPDGRQFTGEPMVRTCDAEAMAAAAALPHVQVDPNLPSSSTCVFIDTKSVQSSLSELEALQNVKVFAFCLADAHIDSTDRFDVVNIPSTHKDAACVGLLVYLGTCLNKPQFTKIAIVSRNECAEVAVKCVTAWSSKTINLYQDVAHAMEWLQTL